MHGYRLRLLALAASSVLGAQARAETPEIEVYVGTRKVSPLPKPPADPAAGPRALVTAAQTLQTATGSALDSAGRVMNRMLERAVPKWELPQIPVVVNITLPPAPAPAPSPVVAAGGFHQTGFSGSTGSSTPGLLPWVNANAIHELVPVRGEPREEPKPTVIIVRDAAPALPAMPVEAPGVKPSSEVLIATVAFFGIALIGTVLAIAGRSSKTSWSFFGRNPEPSSIRDGHVTVGGCDAGPLPLTAEKFDLGPTYSEQIVQEQATIQAGENAMLQFILEQNLTMRAELAN